MSGESVDLKIKAVGRGTSSVSHDMHNVSPRRQNCRLRTRTTATSTQFGGTQFGGWLLSNSLFALFSFSFC